MLSWLRLEMVERLERLEPRLFNFRLLTTTTFVIEAVPRNEFGSADCDTIYTIYRSIYISADPNSFRDKAYT